MGQVVIGRHRRADRRFRLGDRGNLRNQQFFSFVRQWPYLEEFVEDDISLYIIRLVELRGTF